MREWIFGNSPVLGFQAVQRVHCSITKVPNHMIFVNTDSVGTQRGSEQLELLKRFRFGIEAADLAPSLARPDDAVESTCSRCGLPLVGG